MNRSLHEPDGAELHRAGDAVLDRLAAYLDASHAGHGPVVELRPVADIARDLGAREWIRTGGLAAALPAFLEAYLARSTRMHHPGYLAHQVAVPHPVAALADLVHGVTNNPMAIYEMGPAAVALELVVVDWMLDRAGWPASRWPGDRGTAPHGAGVLTHGGSLATLTALLAARAAAAPDAWDAGTPDDLVVLAPPSSHYAIARAVSILGLGSRALRPLPVDAAEVLDADALPAACDRVEAEGRRVMAVVANACATSTGFYDPLAAVARVCRQRGYWLHVDGAHGASALASPRERHRLAGLEGADSLVWDAHKMLRTSALCTAVLFRDERWCEQAFREEAAYLFYGEHSRGIDLIHRTVECTKAGLGLRAFVSLAVQGEAGVAAYVEGRCDAARRFARLIRARDGFECPFEPQSNIVCFRVHGDNERQIAVRDALLLDGRYHLSSTEIAGVRYLRLAVMSPLTDDATIAGLLDAIEGPASPAPSPLT